jgi:Lrp/AsnC family transcriptional regulator for asnA, asnC and gidA
LDQLDVLILSELLKDARQPFSKLAKNLGVAPQTVIRRYESLRKNQIRYASIRIDTKKLGYVGVAHLFLKISSGTKTSEAINQLKQTAGVFIITNTLGDYDAYAEMMFKSFSDLSEKINLIKNFPNVQKISFALSTNDDSLLPPKFDLFK